MADKSGIEWTDATWNPIVGCSIVSPGCTHCYAMAMAARIERMAVPRAAAGDGRQTHYAGTTQASKAGPVWTGKVALAPEHILLQPLKWAPPRRIFVNSMGDLFHEDVPDAWIDRVFAVMALAPQHKFQVLTKRSARMRAYCSALVGGERFISREAHLLRHPGTPTKAITQVHDHCTGPLPNVWLGVSTEDQRRADERVPDLLATPAAVRFVSAEPLLGPIDFRAIDLDGGYEQVLPLGAGWMDRLEPGELEGARLDWIIVGGESGPGARPMHPDWARSIRDQCAAAGVAFFMKQMSGPVKARMPAIPDDLIIREMPHA